MPKTTTQADKEALLAKMARERRELADAVGRAAPARQPGRGWAATTALAAGAAVGWPPFLRQPLRAMAAVAVRDRIASLWRRRRVRRASGPLPDAEIARLAQLVADLRAAAERADDPRAVEQLRLQLDEQVRRLRALRQAPADAPPPAPTA
ncbi:hypothetical protein [Bordetella genomosp. 2]|uniref:Uncharacterized protein n=1 Tax=Bordetella genomosp. 2 TaxID=1983456 RepID=A0A261VI42_9BORD|nr:hypothetical protein [Bordetella genomosp. 2]OZI73735.1 hypothetical protein CAL24_17980 [Bordetella genomosp. 2]